MITSLDTFIPKVFESSQSNHIANHNQTNNTSRYIAHQKGGKINKKKTKSNFGIPTMYHLSNVNTKCRKRNCNKEVFDIFDNIAIDDQIINRLFEKSMYKFSRSQSNPSKLKKSKLNYSRKYKINTNLNKQKTRKRVR